MVRGTFANIRIRNFLAPGTEGGVTKYLGPPRHSPEQVRSAVRRRLRASAAGRSVGMTDLDTLAAAKARMIRRRGRLAAGCRRRVRPTPEGKAQRRRRHRQGDFDLRRGHEIQSRRRADRHPGRRGIRHGQLARLGRQGNDAAGRAGGHRQSFERIHRSNLVNMGVLPLQFLDGQTWKSLGLTGEETYDIPDLGDNLQPRSNITVIATAPDGTAKTFEAHVRSTRPSSWTTTATAASCRRWCGSCWPPSRRRSTSDARFRAGRRRGLRNCPVALSSIPVAVALGPLSRPHGQLGHPGLPALDSCRARRHSCPFVAVAR